MAVHQSGETIGIADLDLGSGRFGLSEVAGGEGLAEEIGQLRPAEVLVSEGSALLRELSAVQELGRRPPWHFDAERAGLTQRTALRHVQGLEIERQKDSVLLDAASRRNLEIDTPYPSSSSISG